VNPFTVKSYWKSYKGLPKKIQRDADRKFDLWKGILVNNSDKSEFLLTLSSLHGISRVVNGLQSWRLCAFA